MTQGDRISGGSGGERIRVQALTKGLAVLRVFDSLQPEWSVEEMAEETGFPKMTVYRLVRTMEEEGYLVLDPGTGRFHLGPALWAANYVSAQRHAELVRFARPYLEELATRTGESVSLAVEVDGATVEVDAIMTSLPFRRQFAPGRVVGYTETAHGKIFAANKSAAAQQAILSGPLERATSNSISDSGALAEELRRVRSEGVAFDLEERFMGTCAVAAPIRDQVGRVMASLGVIAPAGRFGDSERKSHSEAVRAVAAALSAFMGYSESANNN